MATISRGAASSHTSLKKLAWGLFLLLIWVGTTAFTLLTTEDLIKGGNGQGVVPSWRILTQLWDLVQGQYGGIEVVAILGAWTVFMVYTAFSVAEWMTDGGAADMLYNTICWLIIIFDGYANWNYLKILPRPEYQWILTFIIFFVLVYCGKKGFNIVLESLGEMGGA